MGYEKIAYEEMDMSIKSILRHCIKNIHIIVIMAMFFSIAIPSIVYILEIKNYDNIVSGEIGGTTETLTDEDKREIEIYRLLIRRKAELEKHYSKSQLMKIDYTNVSQGVIQYYVETNEVPREDISKAIENYLESASLKENLSRILPLDEIEYIDEIMEVTTSDNGNGIVMIEIVTENEATCKAYMDAIKRVVSEYGASIQSSLEMFEIKILQDSISSGVVSEIYEKQMKHLGDLKVIVSEVQSYEVTLSATQKAFIANANTNVEVQNENIGAPKFNILYLIIGGIIGVVCGVGYLYLQLICGRTLQTDMELHKRFGMSNLGLLFVGKNNVINKFINAVLYKKTLSCDDAQIERMCSIIELNLRGQKNKVVNFVSSTRIDEFENLKRICEMLEVKQIKCEVISNVLYSKDLCSTLDKDHKLVLVENIGKSKIEDIYRMIQICKDASMDLIGYISTIE